MPRTSNAKFMAPVQPDAVLGAIVGNEPMPRTEITRRLWAYIKKNGLQDQKERRRINLDEKFAAFAGADDHGYVNGYQSITMFEMAKLVSGHVAKIE